MKTCFRCQQEKEETDFDLRSDNLKRSNECKACRRARLLKKKVGDILKKPSSVKTCELCGCSFLKRPVIGGKRQNNTNRKHCYECVPHGFKHEHREALRKEESLSGLRTCESCGEKKTLDEKNFDLNQQRKTCRACASKRTINVQKKRKQECIKYKGGKCQLCGYSKSPRALHFHHLAPGEKDFNLASYRCRSWERTKKELDKCALLCANCHAEVHDGLAVL
jgi:hypothetical protein